VQPAGLFAQRPIMVAADQQMSKGFPRLELWNPGEDFIDVAFAVGDHGRQARVDQRGAGGQGGGDPAMALLGLDGLGLVIGGLGLVAAPYRGSAEPQNVRRPLGLHHHDRMDEQAHVGAVAHLAQVPLAAGLGLIVDLAGILDQ
jgi:hypothetical protein